MTTQDFINKYLGQSKGYPTDSLYKGECLSIVKLYIKEMYGIDPPPSGTNSAYGYWTNFPSPLGTKFEKVLNTDTLIPEEGWIAIWQPWASNQYGHIAIVDDGCTTTKLINNAQNWTSKVFQKETNNYNNVIGYLKPKQLPVEENMTDNEKILLEFIRVNKITEGQLIEGYGYVKDGTVAEKDKQIQTLQSRVLDLEKSQKDLEDRLTALESNIEADLKLIDDQQKAVVTANKKVEELIKDLKAQSDEKNSWKNRYEQALKDQVNKYTGWQLVKMGIQKLIVNSQK